MVDVETEHSDAQNACITHHRIGMERTAAEKKPLKLQRWAIRFFFKMFLPFLPSFRSHLFSLSYRSVVRAQAQAICWTLTHTLPCTDTKMNDNKDDGNNNKFVGM